MEATTILERKTLVWQVEKDVIYVDTKDGRLLLNPTVKEVWEMTNGEDTVSDICSKMVLKYQDQNEVEDIVAIVNETVEMLLKYELVEEKKADDFDGWVRYE